MFTGIIEELGIIVDLSPSGTSLCLKIEAGRIFSKVHEDPGISQNGLKIGDSIAVNGVCLTATDVKPPCFEVTAVRETLEKTTLGSLTIGTRRITDHPVNLERAATLETRLGGHLVQGHVDGTALLREIRDADGSWQFTFELPRMTDRASRSNHADGFERYVVPKGSIALDGISLTVAKVESQMITIAVIPHTYEHTNIRFLKIGDRVNVEFDVIAKMVERLMPRV